MPSETDKKTTVKANDNVLQKTYFTKIMGLVHL